MYKCDHCGSTSSNAYECPRCGSVSLSFVPDEPSIELVEITCLGDNSRSFLDATTGTVHRFGSNQKPGVKA